MKMRCLNVDEINEMWPDISPLFQRVVDKAVHGEFSVSDIYEMAVNEHARVCVISESDELISAFALEFRHYPKRLAVNILAFGGKRFYECADSCLGLLKDFCRAAGADWMECLCSRAMEKILGKVGFKSVYQNLRLELQEGMQNDQN